jgi:light-regulated signal transduction histidine kinase (bacteriophytochrome)
MVELERSNAELLQFAYVASHDLQEPLRKIQAFGDRLKTRYREALDERGRDYFDRMQNASKRMQSLVNNLLTLSRITTRAQPFVPVNLADVMQEMMLDLELYIERTDGRVEAGNMPTIDADPTQMRQLLQNLINNGLKFHRPEVKPVVKVYGQVLNEICRLIVEDNGIGFDEKYLDRIFAVFQRLHGRGEYDGTGVGLAICQKIAERHGGSITAKSTPGQGAKFIVTLPVRQPRRGELSNG